MSSLPGKFCPGMERVHNAIEWYQKKIGSYDKQLWEQSVERKLQKQPEFILQNAPRKKVRLKTEFIDVDLIRGSTFTKTKPQVPWVYVTKKALARVIFFPFYYNWWIHQTSRWGYACLLCLYVLQVTSICVYISTDDGHLEDELSFTEVILPMILMFLLCLIHSQTVLAHITHKPPKHNKTISGVTRKPKPKPKKAARKSRNSGGNSTCPEDGMQTTSPRQTRQRSSLNSLGSLAKGNHASQPCTRESSSAQPLVTVSADGADVPRLVAEKQIQGSDQAGYEGHKNSCGQGVAFSSVHGNRLSSSLSSFSSASKSQVNPAPREFRGQNNVNDGESICSSHLYPSRSTTEGHSSFETPGEGDELEQQYDPPSCEIPTGPTSSCSLDSSSFTLLGNLRSMSSDDGQQYFLNTSISTYDRERVGSTTEGSTVSSCEDLKPEQVCQNGSGLEHHEKKHTSVSTSFNRMTQIRSSDIFNGKSVSCLCVRPGNDEYLSQPNREVQGSAAVAHSKSSPSQGSSKHASFAAQFSKSEAGHKNSEFLIKEPGSKTRDTSSDSGNVSVGTLSSLSYRCSLESDNSLSYLSPDVIDEKIHVTNPDERGVKSKELLTQRSLQYVNSLSADQKSSAGDLKSGHSLDSRETVLAAQISSDQGSSHRAGGKSFPDKIIPIMSVPVGCCSQATVSTSASDITPITAQVKALPVIESVQRFSQELVDKILNKETLLVGGSPLLKSGSESDSSLHLYTKDNISECGAPNVNSTRESHLDSCSVFSSPSSKCLPSSSAPCKNKKPNDYLYPIEPESFSKIQVPSHQPSHTDNAKKELYAAQRKQQLQFSKTSQGTVNFDSMHGQLYAKDILEESNISDVDDDDDNLVVKEVDVDADVDDDGEDEGGVMSDFFNHKSLGGSGSDEEIDKPIRLKQLRFQEGLLDGKSQGLEIEAHRSLSSNDGFIPSDDPNDTFKAKLSVGKKESCISNQPTCSVETSQSVPGILAHRLAPSKNLNCKSSNSPMAPATSSASEAEVIQQQRNTTPSGSAVPPCYQQQHQQTQLRRRRRVSGPTSVSVGDVTGATPTISVGVSSSTGSTGSPRAQAGEAKLQCINGGKNVPKSLGIRMLHESVLRGHHGDKHVSSSENEGMGGQTPEGSLKAAVSSEEWEDRIQTDDTTSSAYSSSCGDSGAESEEGGTRSGRSLDDDGEERTEYTTSTLHVINLLQPDSYTNSTAAFHAQGGSPSNSGGNVTQSDKVSCLIWEGNECKKVDLTALDIGWAIIDKVDSLPESSDYFLIGLLFSVIIGLMPLVFRAWVNKENLQLEDLLTIPGLLGKMAEVPNLIVTVYSWRQWLLLVNSVMQRFFLSLIFFFLLSVADRTFKQRLLYAKHFSYLTSSRRARKFTMPHFRLSKVRNIKIWLSLRSYLKRRGPQRSVDVIVSACFMCAICTVSLISLQMLKDTDNYLEYLCNWELLVWCFGLAIFLMRFMTVGLKINKKYRNLSVLITEQINLYLQMEQKPHKKEELILANNVLRLAEDLLKELESPFKISGFSANPVIYNIMRVVVLSAFSAVLTEVLGFKLKLYKIKLKG